MLIVFTGNGKGKTTAALGQAMRAVGEGKRVLMVQFIKGPWKSGEDILQLKVKNQKLKIEETTPSLIEGLESWYDFKLIKTGLGFVGILGDELPRKDHERAAEEGLAFAKKEVESGTWDVLILDEVNNAVELKLISKDAILEFIDGAEKKLEHIILTGRDAPKEFIDRAELVTEMRDLKHPFEEGIKARRGLEY